MIAAPASLSGCKPPGGKPEQRLGRERQLSRRRPAGRRAQVDVVADLEFVVTLGVGRRHSDRRVLGGACLAWREASEEADHHGEPVDEQRSRIRRQRGRRIERTEHVPAVERDLRQPEAGGAGGVDRRRQKRQLDLERCQLVVREILVPADEPLISGDERRRHASRVLGVPALPHLGVFYRRARDRRPADLGPAAEVRQDLGDVPVSAHRRMCEVISGRPGDERREALVGAAQRGDPDASVVFHHAPGQIRCAAA